MSAQGFRQLQSLWRERDRRDEYFGTLVNAYLAAGGRGTGVKAGKSYVDVGTIDGYRTAMALLAGSAAGNGRSRLRAGGSLETARAPAITNDGAIA